MKGLIVNTRIAGECERLEVALPEGSVDVSFELNRYAQMMGVGGYDMVNDTHIAFWKGAHLQPGDEIQIEFADIENPLPPIHQETHSSLVERMVAVADNDDEEEVWKHKLERYHRLKAILEEEGLI